MDEANTVPETFVRVFLDDAKRLGIQNHLVGRGTVYPDTIEVTIRTNTTARVSGRPSLQ